MKFSYKARNKEGKIETGIIEAYSKEEAGILLQKYNIFVTYLEPQRTGTFFLKGIKFGRKISKKELAIFFRQLSVMLESRVPVVQSLSSLAEQNNKPYFKEALVKISSLVQQGTPLSEAFATFPKTFDNFYVNLIKSGEASGKIASAFFYISENLEREDDINSQVNQAMIYPIFLVGVLLIVLSVIVVGVMPRISDLIREAGGNPSASTLLILAFYKFLENYWWMLIVGLIFIVISLIYYFNTKMGAKNYDRLSLKMPFLGNLLKKVFLARFCGNVSTLLIAGISINTALKITEDTVNNIVYKGIIAQIGKEVSEGGKMSAAMLKYQAYYPLFVVQMIRVGEETGKLDKTLMEVVNFYQKDIKRTIDLFTRFLEPIMIIFLGLIVTVLSISVLSSLYGAIGTI